MVENQQVPRVNEDDMDLLDLFEKVSLFFRHYFRLIAIFTILGTGLGFTLYKVSPKLYTSTILLHSFTLTNTEQINIIENWNDLIKSNEYEALGKLLNCPTSVVRNVKEITAEEIQRLYSENNPNGFNVWVLVTDNNILDSLQQGIIYGLENSDYMKERLATKRSGYSQLVDKIKIEISKLDSTKENIEKNINNNTPHNTSYLIDISDINIQMITLNEKLLQSQEQLKFTSAVQVLHKFEKFKRPYSPKLIKLLVLGFIGGFTIGYIIAVYLSLRKKLSMRRK